MALPRNYSHRGDSLWFQETKVTDLVEQFGSPLRVTTPAILKENYDFLMETVRAELATQGISADRFECGYAIKANQVYELVSTAAKHTDFIEASSENDLALIELLADKIADKKIICHGFKPPHSKYLQKILKMHEEGFNIIPVADSVVEVRFLANMDTDMKWGIRVNAKTRFNDNTIRDRFGLTPHEILENITAIQNRNLVLLHMHIANTMVSANKRLNSLEQLLDIFYALVQRGVHIQYVSTGGGLPSRSHTDDVFYAKFYKNLIASIAGTIRNLETFPILLNESGRFLAEETQYIVLDVILKKQNNRSFSWYLLNGSAINLIPETLIDPAKKFPILAANHLDKPTESVVCVGITCDPEDYFHTDIKQLPTFPALEPGSRLHIIIPNTGAYQESLIGSGRNQPGHCLINAPKEIVQTDTRVHESNPVVQFPDLLKYPRALS